MVGWPTMTARPDLVLTDLLCSTQLSCHHGPSARDVLSVVDKACTVVSAVSPDAKDICVTTNELRWALSHLLARRASAGVAQADTSPRVVVELPKGDTVAALPREEPAK